MPEQLPIWAPNYRLHEEYERVRAEFAGVVHHVTTKEFCDAVDAKPSDVSHAIKERAGHHIQGLWLTYALKVAPNLSLATALLAPARLEPQRIITKTPEQENIEWRQLAAENPAMREEAKRRGLLR